MKCDGALLLWNKDDARSPPRAGGTAVGLIGYRLVCFIEGCATQTHAGERPHTVGSLLICHSSEVPHKMRPETRMSVRKNYPPKYHDL